MEKNGSERATKTREYDLLRPEKATKTRKYDLLRIRMGQKKSPRPGSTICYGSRQKEPSRGYDLLCIKGIRFVTNISGSERATKTRAGGRLRFIMDKRWPERAFKTRATIYYERAPKTRGYDVSQIRVGQKEQPRPGGTFYYGQEWDRKNRRINFVKK